MTDRETINVYNARADEYDKLDTSGKPSDTLSVFIAALPENGRVLDMGCGPGTCSRHMAVAGLCVDAMDASSEMIALAEKIEGVTAWIASFDDLDARSIYDGVWANFSLLHAPRRDMPRHLAAIKTALKPGGMRDRLGRQYAYYTIPEMTELLKDQGFTPGPVTQGRDRGLDGSIAPWFSLSSYA